MDAVLVGEKYLLLVAAAASSAGPVTRKKNSRLMVSQIILDTMKELGMSYPTVDKERLEELQVIRKEL